MVRQTCYFGGQGNNQATESTNSTNRIFADSTSVRREKLLVNAKNILPGRWGSVSPRRFSDVSFAAYMQHVKTLADNY